MLLSLGLCHSCSLEDREFSLPFVLVCPCDLQEHFLYFAWIKLGIDQIVWLGAIIGSSGCTGQVIPRSYSEKIGQAPETSRVTVSGWLPCSVTRLQLPGMQGLDCMKEESSTDQDEGFS